MPEVGSWVHSSYSDLQGAEPVGRAPALAPMSVLKPVPILAGMCLGWDPDLGVTAVLSEQGPMDSWKLEIVRLERKNGPSSQFFTLSGWVNPLTSRNLSFLISRVNVATLQDWNTHPLESCSTVEPFAASTFYRNYWDMVEQLFVLEEVSEEYCLDSWGFLYTLRVKGKRGHV